MNNKKIIKLLPFLLVLPVILFVIFNFHFNKDFNNVVSKFLVKEGNEVEEVEPYTYEEVQMLAVSLRVKETYGESFKMVPLTCSVNVNRTIKLIYMDGEEQLGYKYINYRKPAGTLLVPSKKGYDFVKWTNEDGAVVDEETVIASDVDYYIYANWEKHISTLTIDPASGKWEKKAEKQEFSMEFEETKNISDPVREGYNFVRWDITGEHSSIDNKIFTMGYENSTLTAVWSPKEYNLFYDVNGGNPLSPSSKKITYTKEYGPLPNPTQFGYSFGGWYTDSIGGSVVTSQTKHMITNDVTIHAHWINTPPTTPQFDITYKNSSSKEEGLLEKNGQEVITVVVSSHDAEENIPNITLECFSGSLCTDKNNVTITGPEMRNGKAVYTITAKKMGIGLLRAVATDTPGLSSADTTLIAVYGTGDSIAKHEKYTDTTFESGWLEELEGCYISEITFTVQFLDSHNNSSETDSMVVTGRRKSGAEVTLFEWTGNMEGDLHQSNTIKLTEYNNTNDPIIGIKFYTYSPHEGCAADASIYYSVKYTFDKKLFSE